MFRNRYLLLALCLSPCVFSMVSARAQDADGTVQAEPQSVKPGINESFLDPDLDVGSFVDRFEVESREIFSARDRVMENLKLQPGDKVADIGTGTGLFVELFSQAVGKDGWVYAIDIAPKFIERVGAITEMKSLVNVTPVLGGQNDIRLAPGSINAAFICDVYHHFEFPADSLHSIFTALEPGGQLVVIDFERIPGVSRDWLLGHVRAGKEVFRKEIETAGFEFVEEVKVPGFRENYFLRFRRPEAK